MEEKKDPKIPIEDLDKDKKPEGEEAGKVTGGAPNLQQSFDPKTVGAPVAEEKVGLVWK